MKKRVFIVHGWGGSPNNDWLPWLKTILLKKNYDVKVPFMPDTENPQIEPWVNKLSETVGNLKNGDIFIGHSVGCQTILRFLESTTGKIRAEKVFLVAPWKTVANLEAKEYEKIAQPWTNQPIDFNKIRLRAKAFVAIFSDNDPFVSLEDNLKFFQSQLPLKTLVLHQRGHFRQEDNAKELPELLLEI